MGELKTWSIAGLAGFLALATGVSLYSLAKERKHTAELAASNQSLGATVSQVQGQLDSVSKKMAALEAQRLAPIPVSPPSAVPLRATRAPRQTRPVDDPRFNQLKSQLSEQEKEIAGAKDQIGETRDQIEQTRGDLQGKLDASHEELSGSIARSHDELVELQKRGERNFYEFQTNKSKVFEKVGPIRISLRKANLKRKSYDLTMMVDDIQIQKKGVNLFEPVYISLSDRPQPLELVVNQVHKDQISGYLSEPKYKKSDLAANAAKPPSEKLPPAQPRQD